jgi:hypothetical protein
MLNEIIVFQQVILILIDEKLNDIFGERTKIIGIIGE